MGQGADAEGQQVGEGNVKNGAGEQEPQRGDDIAGACGQLAGEIKNRRSSRRGEVRASSLTFK